MALRPAQIVAVSVEVSCPYCCEPLPSPGNGSDIWLPSEVAAHGGKATCPACDERFAIIAQSTAVVRP